MNTPRADIVSSMDTISDLCNKGWCELYINNDGSLPGTHNIEIWLETIALLREHCQFFLDISGPEELTYIATHPHE